MSRPAGFKLTDEHKNKISISRTGQQGNFSGLEHTGRSKRKMSISASKRKHSEETKRKIGLASSNKSAESKEKSIITRKKNRYLKKMKDSRICPSCQKGFNLITTPELYDKHVKYCTERRKVYQEEMEEYETWKSNLDLAIPLINEYADKHNLLQFGREGGEKTELYQEYFERIQKVLHSNI